jgi:DNA invertase Pin-like site-specific DNA recombinase
MSKPVRAAVYYRMSSDKQEDSIDRQKSQVLPYAEKHGYQVTGEYLDEGITGSEIVRRKSFQRLLRDAQAGAFDLILCDDQDRFGRFDSIDLGEIAAPLRRKGIWLETVAQGEIDWNSFGGRLQSMVKQEAGNQEQVAISRRVLTGMLRKAMKGAYLGGPVSYGLKTVADPDPEIGKRLVPDGRKADVVKLIFELYDQGHSLGSIARELFNRGVANPRGGARWSRGTLVKILRQRKYVGDFRWAVQRCGKRFRVTGGAIQPAPRGEGYTNNPSEGWIVVPDHYEALVSRDLFERVQARLKGNQGNTTPHVGGGEFLLSKLLVCGHCGAYMFGHTQRGQRIYCCGGYKAYGVGYCKRNQVNEAPLVGFLLRKLQESFLDPANLAKLREEVSAIEQAARGDDNLNRLRKQLDGLDKKIRQGGERLLTLPPDVVPDAAAHLRDWKKQREAVQAELHRATNESPTATLEESIATVESALWRLKEALSAEDAVLLRKLLREMVSKIELRWTHEKARNGQNGSRLEGGTVYLRPQEGGVNLFPDLARRAGRAASCGNGTAPPG